MKTYGTAYITQPTGHDFSQILDFCSEIKFVSTGYEQGNPFETFEKSLADFIPEEDVLVPVGSTNVNFMLGVFVERLRSEKKCEFVNVAIYHDHAYRIETIGFEGVLERKNEWDED